MRTLLSAFVLLSLVGCSAPAGDATSTGESDLGTCASGKHECNGWGATCNGTSLETCVVGADGCRKLLAQPCSLGCSAGACTTCDAVPSPVASQATSAAPAFYETMVKSGNVAFAAFHERNGVYQQTANGIATIDLSNPKALATVATKKLPDQTWVRGLAVAGTRLLALEAAKLEVYDASNPASLALVSSYTPVDTPSAIAASGNLAFVASNAGIDVVDVSGAAAQLVGVVATSVHPLGVAASGTRVAVAGDDAVEMIDVSIPSAPVVVAKVQLGARVVSYSSHPLELAGPNAYVLATPPGDYSLSQLYVTSFDASKSPAMSVVGTVPRLGAHTLSLEGSRIALEIGEAVASVDVSTPSAPKLVEYTPLPKRQQSVLAGGATIFASGIDGVTAVDLDRSPDVTLLPANKAFGQTAVSGAVAYMARGDAFVAEDIRDPAHPIVLSSTPMAAEGVVVDGHHAYVTVENEGLRVYDVMSPWEPKLLSSVAVPRDAWSANPTFFSNLSYANGRAYAQCGISSICVFDVSSPNAATLVTKSDAALQWLGGMSAFTPLAIRDGLVFLPNAGEMRILDMTNAAAPVRRGTVKLGGYETGQTVSMSLAGKYAYVGYACHYVYGDTCIDVVDVSNPDAPVNLSSTVLGAARQLDERRGMAWLRAYGKQLVIGYPRGRIDVLDLTDPVHPAELLELYTPASLRVPFATDRFLVGSTQDGSQTVDQVIALCK